MCARDRDDEELDDEFEVRVRRQRERMETARREKGQSFWSYLGLIGMVGWGVVAPMVAGALVGLWLDDRFGTGKNWTLGLLVMGLVIGCFNAWRSITKEQ